MKSFVKVLVLFLYCGTSLIMASRVGGITDNEKESSPEVQEMVELLGTEIKSSAMALFTESDGAPSEEQFKAANITALGHKTQVVAGANYFVRTKIGDYIFHVRIYRDLKKNVSLSKIIGPKKESDPIEYF